MTNDPNLRLLMTWLAHNNDTSETVRRSVRDILHPFVSLFILVGVIGLISNIALLVIVVRRRLYQHSVFLLVANLAVVEVVRCVLVLPLLLIPVFIKGWRLGSFLCFVWPIILPCTIHVSVFGLLAVFIFRYLKVVHNAKCPIPAWTCIVIAWLLSVAIQTPHAAFKRYVDLKPHFGPTFEGIGICVLRPGAEEKNKEYVLSVFVVFFVAILITVLVLAMLIHIRIKRREQEFPPESTSFLMEMNIRVGEKDEDEEDNLKYPNSAMLDCEEVKSASSMLDSDKHSSGAKTEPLPQTDPTVTSKKSRLKQDNKMQKFLVMLTVFFTVLWLPFYIHYQIEAVTGNEEPRSYLLYLLLLLIGYLSSWSLPLSFSLWQMSKATRYKIRSSLNPRNWQKKIET